MKPRKYRQIVTPFRKSICRQTNPSKLLAKTLVQVKIRIDKVHIIRTPGHLTSGHLTTRHLIAGDSSLGLLTTNAISKFFVRHIFQ